jgi:hypothetical protein
MSREVYKVQIDGHTIGYVRKLRDDWGIALTAITDDPERDPGQYIGWHPTREVAELELKAWARVVYNRLSESFA